MPESSSIKHRIKQQMVNDEQREKIINRLKQIDKDELREQIRLNKQWRRINNDEQREQIINRLKQIDKDELREQVQQMNNPWPWQIDEDELSPQMEQSFEIKQRQLKQLQWKFEIDQQKLEQLQQKRRKFVLRYQWQSLDLKVTSFIGFLYGLFSEEQRNEVLVALHRLEKSKASKRVIRYKQIVFLLELVWAKIQTKYDDIWLPRKNQRVDK